MIDCCNSCKEKEINNIKDALSVGITTERLSFDAASKTLVSIRDGYQEYAGIEIGEQPHDKTFKVFRSNDTIQEASKKLGNIPIIDGHIDLVDDIPQDKIIGYIETSEIKDNSKFGYDSSIKVLNRVKVSEKVLKLISDGTRELSLGYKSQFEDSEKYDFEQVGIVPHHLAIVEQGRCGAVCSFNDQKKGKVMDKEKSVLDEGMTVEQLMELVAKLPQLIGQADISNLGDMVEPLQKALSLISPTPPEAPAADMAEGEEVPAEDMAEEGEEKKAPFEDEGEEEKEKADVKDSVEFKDALKIAVSDHLVVITKAKSFLDESYVFIDKSAKQIMIDAVATQYKDEFKDEELSTAFKLLKKTNDYQKFGVQKDNWDSIADKEI